MESIPFLPFRTQNHGEESGMLSRWLLGDGANLKEMRSGHQLIQRHGVKLVRTHLYDWLVLAFLLMLIIVLNTIHPFYRFVSKEMLTDIRYPHRSNAVPSWAVPVISIILPLMVVFPVCYFKKDVYDLHHAILGLLFSVLITGVITDAIKDAVGRPRPDFFWRCFPDGNESYDPVTGNVVCHGEEHLIVDGHKSFPSGHTSWSFAGLGFLALYLSGKIKAFDQRGHVSKLCIIFLPLFIASLVGISRVDDYRHHWQDVFAGGLLGLVVATFCYLQFFPAPYHSNGWATHAYFRALTEFNVASDPSNNANQQSEAVINFGSPRPQSSMIADDELESGRDEELQALIDSKHPF